MHIYTHTYIYIHIYTHVRKYINTHIYTYHMIIFMYSHIPPQSRELLRLCKRAYEYTHIIKYNTYSDIYIFIYIPPVKNIIDIDIYKYIHIPPAVPGVCVCVLWLCVLEKYIYIFIHMYIYVCTYITYTTFGAIGIYVCVCVCVCVWYLYVCVCVCVCERERVRDTLHSNKSFESSRYHLPFFILWYASSVHRHVAKMCLDVFYILYNICHFKYIFCIIFATSNNALVRT